MTFTQKDTSVTQTVRTTNGQFPILVRGTSAGTSTTTTSVSFAKDTTVNLNTGLLTEAGILMQRKYGTLMPFGTAIPANADLNTIDYIKVGNYYCSKNTDVETLTNSPTESAFMMQVYSPLSTTIDNESTGTWVYRFRVMQVYTGARYTQYIYSNGTAGNFSYGAWQLTVESEADGAVGSTTKSVYLSNGKITEGSTYAGGTAVTLNGVAKGASTASFYAPTAAGTAGQILKSTAGSPEWASITNSAATLTSGSLVTVANIAGTDITVKLPAATDKIAGATIVYQAQQCTTFTSDSGTCTPAAVKKAVGLFVVDGDNNGQIKVNGSNITVYSLPTASSSTLGGVKIGTGIGISDGVISNSGVRSISTGTTNGTISVNTNGTAADVAVKGLGSLAYSSTAPIANGGTGATNASDALINLGAAATNHTHTGMWTNNNLTFSLSGTTLTITTS